MNYVELSIKSSEEVCKELYEKIKSDYDYDLVIFVARGSYIIGRELASLNNVPLLEVFATRSGGKLKKLVRPILCLIPRKLKVKLRKMEVNSNVHEKNIDRNVSYDESKWSRYKTSKKILLVDDSVDTGYSILSTKNAIEDYFDNAEIRVAAINYFKKSEDIVKTDYFLYTDTMLNGPWSNDSKENKKYMKMYEEWKNGD